MIQSVWVEYLKWGGVTWVAPNNFQVFYVAWHETVTMYIPRKAWMTAFAVVIWNIL